MKNKFKLGISLLAVGMAFSSFNALSAELDYAQELQQNPEEQVSLALATDPNLRWAAYLKDHNLVEGVNTRGENTFFIAVGEAIVGKNTNDKGFIDSRSIAYNKAMLVAKSELAESVGVELSSERANKLFELGGELPPSMEVVRENLSIMDKALVLSDKALDDQIRRFEPTWDGTGVSPEEKQRKIAIQQEIYTENLAQNSQLFLQGASPIFNSEGPSLGEYTVVVGILWSPNFARIAESMQNPTVVIEPGTSKGTIKSQIEIILTDNPDFLASTMGVRVWRNELGERTVVSFASASGVGSPIIAKKKTALISRSQIAQFIAESIVSNDTLSRNETVNYYDDDSHKAFDQGRYEREVTGKSKDIELNGASSVFIWKGLHPISKQKMVVNVTAWSPSSQKAMQAIKGSVNNTSSPAEDKEVEIAPAGGLIGATTDPSDF